jgi:iron complex transport system substrate-binding protein
VTVPARRPVVAVLLVLLLLVVAACGGAGPSPSTEPSAAPSVAPSPSAATFPVTLSDDEGTDVVIPAEPQRIASLTPANTEIAFAVGAGDRVVATDDGSDTPTEAAALPDVATFQSVDVEAILGLEVDLVLAGGLGFTSAEAIAQLRDLDIPVLVLYAPSVEGVYEDIQLVGDATGTSAVADDLVTEIRTEMDAIAAAVAEGEHPRTFYEVGYTDATGEIFAPAEDSFVAEMVTLAGGDTITTGDPASYAIPLEALIEADPEIIVLGTNPFYQPTPEQVAARPGWDVMTAVKDGAIVPVQDTEITRPGPRLPIGLRNLAAAIRPDVTLPPAP